MNKKKQKIFIVMKKYAAQMTAYQEDITVHDLNTLNEYDGQFLWSYDEMSTHFIKLVIREDEIRQEAINRLVSLVENINWNKTGRKQLWFLGNTIDGNLDKVTDPVRVIRVVLN